MDTRRVDIHVIGKLIVNHVVVALLMLDGQAHILVECEEAAVLEGDFTSPMATNQFAIRRKRGRSCCYTEVSTFVGVVREVVRSDVRDFSLRIDDDDFHGGTLLKTRALGRNCKRCETEYQ